MSKKHPTTKRQNRRENRRKIRNAVKHNMVPDGGCDFEEFEVSNTQPRKRSEPLYAKTEAQGHMIMSIKDKVITFVTGPAGTGKTYISAGLAAEALENKSIDKIIITRPMVSCDEDMGALPGNEEEKYAPWVRPVMDVFIERLGLGTVEYLLKSKKIEWMPLQRMRGMSIKRSWVILDEAQNTTPSQMKMFLTRLGEGSKLIIDGDVEQSDLKDGRGYALESGLSHAIERIGGHNKVGLVNFDENDIVRHGLIKDIILAYR